MKKMNDTGLHMVRVLKALDDLEKAVFEAAQVLRRGGLVIYPTETVYGLGGDARSDDVAKKIFDVKGRKIDSPISIAVSSAETIENFAYIPKEAKGLLRLVPGPVTLVMRAKGGISKLLLSKGGNIGIRVPDHPVALRLVEAAGFPITSTSANISGSPSPSTVQEAIEQVGPHVDLALDGGRCAYSVPSTVVDLTVSPFRILREGPVKRERIDRAVGLSR